MEIVLVGIALFVAIKFKIFRALISWYHKADAATAIQNLLEHQQRLGFFDGNPAAVANQYVQSAWDSKPNVFDGGFGSRPHKLSVVMYSLAFAAKQLDVQKHRDFGPTMIALGNVISELEVNGSYYPLSSVDHALAQDGMEMIAPIMERESKNATVEF